MTQRCVATAKWQRLEDGGHDTCRLLAEHNEWHLSGTVHCSDYALAYTVTCGSDWQTQSATVSGQFGGKQSNWVITRMSDGWRMNDQFFGLPDCIDIDLAITPATNALPIRRLNLSPGSTAEVSAIWFRPDDGGSLTRLTQSYSRVSDQEYVYSSSNFCAPLSVHPSGLVMRYGDVWEGPVRDG